MWRRESIAQKQARKTLKETRGFGFGDLVRLLLQFMAWAWALMGPLFVVALVVGIFADKPVIVNDVERNELWVKLLVLAFLLSITGGAIVYIVLCIRKRGRLQELARGRSRTAPTSPSSSDTPGEQGDA